MTQAATTQRTHNVLDMNRSFKLAQHLSDNQDSLRGLNRPTIAARASEALGFSVTVNNVSAAEKAAGVRLVPERSKVKKPSRPLASETRALAAELLALYGRLGEAPNKRLLEMAGVAA